MSRQPWHAANHCNISFEEFLRRKWSPGHWGHPGVLGPRRPPYCPKYEGMHRRLHMLYERAGGASPADVLELRAWKARRALELCQARACYFLDTALRVRERTTIVRPDARCSSARGMY